MPHHPTPSVRGWRQFVAGMILYALAIVAASISVRAADPSTAVRFALAVAPAVALLWAMAGWLTVVRAFDELGRRVFAEAAAITLAVLLAGTVTHGLLQAFAGIPPVGGLAVFAAGGLVYTLASVASWRRYR